jgi:tyrosine-protein kinase Etk/Wzc
VDDRAAARAAALANGYAEELRRTTKRLAMSEAGQRRQFFEDQVEQVKEELSRSESIFSAVQQKTGILQVDAQAKALIETSAALRGQIAAGEVQLRALRNFGTEQNPDVRQQESQLNGWRAELSRLESQSSDPVFSKGRAPAQSQEYMHAMRDVRYGEAVLEMLLRQSEAAKLDEAREATIIQVVDVAVPPDVRTSPKRTAIVLLTTFAALLATLCLLRLRQLFHARPEWQIRMAELRAEWRS